MKWTEISKPVAGISFYTHTILKTPVGEFIIEWKGWKENPDYDILLDGTWITVAGDLEEAKEFVETYLTRLRNELNEFLENG